MGLVIDHPGRGADKMRYIERAVSVSLTGSFIVGFLLFVFSLAPAAAFAGQTHLFQRDLGASAFLAGPQGVAVDPETQNVYATDSVNNFVDRFEHATAGLDAAFGVNGQLSGSASPLGSFERPYGIAVDPSSGDVYVADAGHGVVDKFTKTGALVASFGDTVDGEGNPAPNGQLAGLKTPAGSVAPTGLAVDAVSGDLYVADRANSAIDVFSSAGAYLSQISTPGPEGSAGLYEPTGVAVDSEGNVYVTGSGFTERYGAASGEPLGQVDTGNSSGGSSAVAVDPSNDDVYIADGSTIVQRASAQAATPNAVVATFGAGHLQGALGLAVNAAGDVLAADGAGNQIVEFGPEATIEAPVVSNLQVTAITDHSAHFSVTVNPGGSGAGYETTYSFQCQPGCSGLAGEASIAGDGADHVIQEDANQLTMDETYTVSVTAVNAGGETKLQQTFKTIGVPPTAITEPAEDIAATHASLQGQVNMQNDPTTTYSYEYGTTTGYGTTVQETEEGRLSSGLDTSIITQPAIVPIYSLDPATTYHYRLVAHNEAGATFGEDESFTTSPAPAARPCPNAQRRSEQNAAILPDCRAWEMVSPLDKNGGDALDNNNRVRASAGESPGLPAAIQYASLVAFGDAKGTGAAVEYLAQRAAQPGTQGWETHSITPPNQEPAPLFNSVNGSRDPAYAAFSPDLTRGAFASLPYSPLTEAPNVEGVSNLYTRTDLRTPGPGSYTLLSRAASPLKGSVAETDFAAASADMSHVIFSSPQALTPEAPPCAGPATSCPVHLFESIDGVTRLAGLIPPAGDISCGGGGAACIPAPESDAGQGSYRRRFHFNDTRRTMSTDGTRIFFTDINSLGGYSRRPSGALFVREDHGTENAADATTTQINVSELGGEDQPSAAPATFWTASTDGSRAFFTTDAALTSAESGGLYMWSADQDPHGHRLTLIVPGAAAGIDVLGASDDGHYVYFIGQATQLVPGKPQNVNVPLYVWHDETGTPQVDYVGAILLDSQLSPNAADEDTQARVTPDGGQLLFASVYGHSLTGYDQQNAACSQCSELYVYSVHGVGPNHQHLQCASCPPSGAPATGAAFNTKAFARTYGGQQFTRRFPEDRSISDDGRYVFFTSKQALVPEATNGVADVYVFETETGDLHLLSSGEDSAPSLFMDASADGRDAYFITRQSLLGWDSGKGLDLYDARVDGGFPEPPAPPPACQGDACQPAPAVVNDATPASATFQGAGDRPSASRVGSKRKHRKVRHKKRPRRRHKAHSRKHTNRGGAK